MRLPQTISTLRFGRLPPTPWTIPWHHHLSMATIREISLPSRGVPRRCLTLTKDAPATAFPTTIELHNRQILRRHPAED
jgi:hypothetical protein